MQIVHGGNLSGRVPVTRTYVLSLVVALLMAVASLAGLYFQTDIYRTIELSNMFVSTDVVNLAIGLPVLLGSLWSAQRFTAVFVTHSVFESVYLSQRIVVMAARPGRVMADFMVEAPYPRDNLFRTSPEYGRLCRIASESLSRAIAA